MRLKDLLSGIYTGQLAQGFADYEISSLSCDSRTIQQNCLFVALAGNQFNGNDFIRDAVARGAVVVVRSGNNPQDVLILPDHVCVLDVDDPKKFLSDLALRFYGNPSRRVKVFGITGTNGKTTVTYLLESIAQSYQKKCAVVGTINYRIGSEVLPSKNTTPSFLENQKFLARLVADNVEYSFMEVSSHALIQGRVELVDFRVAVFTNLTGDHLDYHKTMEEYFRAKSILFTSLSREAVAVINADDPYGRRLLDLTEARIFTYGFDPSARVRAKDIQFDFTGSSMVIETPVGSFQLNTPLIGTHNVYNILAAVGAGLADGIGLDVIKEGLEHVKLIPGRLEKVECGSDSFVFIDYAHTEDGLKNVLQALRLLTFSSPIEMINLQPSATPKVGDLSLDKERSITGKAKIITVFGCGGDRDRTKRPKMGKVACELSDHAIVTTDNPRSEEPQAIIDEICVGFSNKNYEVIVDRTQAIHRALSMASKGDVVLIAGKGHETYQIFKDRTIDYDERDVIRDFLKAV